MASDNGGSSEGWRVDTVDITGCRGWDAVSDSNTHADPADAHTNGKSDCYSNGNTYNYAHTYDYSFTNANSNSYQYAQSNTAASSHAAAAAKSIEITAMMAAK